MSNNCFVIAEAGVNHNGDLTLAKKLIELAADAGANAVKFQTFSTPKLVKKTAQKASYQIDLTGGSESQFTMLESLELSEDDFLSLKDCADKHNIEFMSTAFDIESLDFLVNKVGVKRLKIPSGEITNGPLLLAHARKGLPLIMSTGMATLNEIHAALQVIAFGTANTLNQRGPKDIDLARAYAEECSKSYWKERITLLHCTSEYPAPLEEINLRAIESISKHFGLPCGYSDHSEGIEVSLAAVALGSTVIEKHFTLDKSLPGPDHMSSLGPDELYALVRGVRSIDIALGSDIKVVGSSELKNRTAVRRGTYAKKNIDQFDLLSMENVEFLRPENGVTPMDFWQMIGLPAGKNYKQGDSIE